MLSGDLKFMIRKKVLKESCCLTRAFELIVEYHHIQVLHEDLLVVEKVNEIN
jgi:hypothetical protein